jgi:hypothetical protein
VHIQPWKQLKPDVAEVLANRRPDIDEIKRYIDDSDAFIDSLDRQGIARVGLINYPSQDLMGFHHSVNDYVAAYRNRHPSRILAFGGLHPRFVENAQLEVDYLLDELKLDGIKIHPPHQLLAPNDHIHGEPTLLALYDGCQERKVPVMVHTGTSVFPGARGKYGDPMLCDDVAVDYPELPLILAHGGRPLWMDTAFHLIRRHKNVYMDLSGIPPKLLLKYFPRLESIADRCLFGTDWPSPGVKTIRDNVDAFLELEISDDAKAQILSGTADALFPSAF